MTLLKQLEQAAAHWKQSLLKVGEIMVALRKAGEPVDLYRRTILRDRFDMPLSTSEVAERWAAGELGESETAKAVAMKVPHSVLAKMGRETVAGLVRGKHRIESPREGRVVVKAFSAMTHDEITANVTAAGIVPPSERLTRRPEYRSFRARSVTIEGNNAVFIGGQRNEIRMIVPLSMLEALRADCAA